MSDPKLPLDDITALRPAETEEQLCETITASILDMLRKEADGVPFDPASRKVRRRFDFAVAEALDEYGFGDTPAR